MVRTNIHREREKPHISIGGKQYGCGVRKTTVKFAFCLWHGFPGERAALEGGGRNPNRNGTPKKWKLCFAYVCHHRHFGIFQDLFAYSLFLATLFGRTGGPSQSSKIATRSGFCQPPFCTLMVNKRQKLGFFAYHKGCLKLSWKNRTTRLFLFGLYKAKSQRRGDNGYCQ